MLSVCNDVESADIPNAMGRVANIVIEQGQEVIDQVINPSSSTESIIEFMEKHPVLSEALTTFMNKHGHRGIFEVSKYYKYVRMNMTYKEYIHN